MKNFKMRTCSFLLAFCMALCTPLSVYAESADNEAGDMPENTDEDTEYIDEVSDSESGDASDASGDASESAKEDTISIAEDLTSESSVLESLSSASETASTSSTSSNYASASGIDYYTSVSSAASYLVAQMKEGASNYTTFTTVIVYYLDTTFSADSVISDIYETALSSYSNASYIRTHTATSTQNTYDDGILYKITYRVYWYSPVSSAGVSYYTSVSKAAVYCRNKMTGRSSSITVRILASSGSSATDALSSLKENIFAYTGNGNEGEYLKYQYSSFKTTSSVTTYREGKLMTFTFKITWDTSSAKEKKVTAKVKSIISSLNLSGKSDYAKLKAIYAWMCKNVSYKKGSSSYHTAYAALINKKACCEGYALAFYYLANYAGITCRFVLSSSHSWNMVKLGGKWYYLDCCWDKGRSFGSYKYFLFGTKYASSIKSHSPKSTYGYTVSKGNYIYTSLSYSSVTYTGSSKKPTVTVRNSNGKKLSSSYYSVSYSTNKKIGKATVTIKGKKGYYSGTVIIKTFTIKPKKAVISSAKSSSKKKLKIKWKKVSGGVSYQIAYKRKGTSKWYYVKVGSSTYSKTISSLKSGKYYYVKVRAFKSVNGTRYYGSWSKTKTVKVK